MSEERLLKARAHVEKLLKVMRIGAGKVVDSGALVGVLAETLTRIDELNDRQVSMEGKHRVTPGALEKGVPADQTHELLPPVAMPALPMEETEEKAPDFTAI